MLEVVAIIPARGGSKRIPRKNLAPVGKRPLLAHTVGHALAAERVDEVIVSTDDDEIASLAAREGARVVARPAKLATDDAATEDAILHALDSRGHDPDLVVLLQPTSPVRRPGDVDGAISTLLEKGADSVLSACCETAFLWTADDDELRSISYDWRRRLRTQELAPIWRENGSIYVTRTAILREHGNRLGGKIAIYEMDRWASFDVDDADDLALADWVISSGQEGHRD